MKKEFSSMPESFTEQWPGELDMFSWKDFLAGIPSPLFVVTGWKSNGRENACLQAWSAFTSTNGEFVCILGHVFKDGHMYRSLKETGCCVLNFPSSEVYENCLKTIANNDFETDEITSSGLSVQKAVAVNAPRIAECFLNIECEFLWEKEHFEGSDGVVVALKAVHMAMEENHYVQNLGKPGRYGKSGYLFNINSPRNPETGASEGSVLATVEILKQSE